MLLKKIDHLSQHTTFWGELLSIDFLELDGKIGVLKIECDGDELEVDVDGWNEVREIGKKMIEIADEQQGG